MTATAPSVRRPPRPARSRRARDRCRCRHRHRDRHAPRRGGRHVAVHYHRSDAGARDVVCADHRRGRHRPCVPGRPHRRRPTSTTCVARITRRRRRAGHPRQQRGHLPARIDSRRRRRDWQAVVAANLTSVHLVTQAVARGLRDAGRGGAIVNIASIEASNVAPAHSHYAAAKAGVVMYTKSAARELGRVGHPRQRRLARTDLARGPRRGVAAGRVGVHRRDTTRPPRPLRRRGRRLPLPGLGRVALDHRHRPRRRRRRAHESRVLGKIKRARPKGRKDRIEGQRLNEMKDKEAKEALRRPLLFFGLQDFEVPFGFDSAVLPFLPCSPF